MCCLHHLTHTASNTTDWSQATSLCSPPIRQHTVTWPLCLLGIKEEEPWSAGKEMLQRSASRASPTECFWSPHLWKGLDRSSLSRVTLGAWADSVRGSVDQISSGLSWFGAKRAGSLFPCIDQPLAQAVLGRGVTLSKAAQPRQFQRRLTPRAVCQQLENKSSSHPWQGSRRLIRARAQWVTQSSKQRDHTGILFHHPGLKPITGLTCEPHQLSLLAIPISLGIKHILYP